MYLYAVFSDGRVQNITPEWWYLESIQEADGYGLDKLKRKYGCQDVVFASSKEEARRKVLGS